ncbi:MAG: MBL fold metallo-hydrolase [Chitinophagaceae bacterium]|jgi:glyoxylase-like metal-dependent hydrolase (beta-lactamase superfamily II)|nr:MBL fold metallo-hydrolase [Chitinophagaceae bacterium]MBP6987273.1 MBL fold metallo-hydrolase [Ferruginibacter sp.]MBK7088631.1 MBL fold metallo-hydrolase [Chitinophagaceae bacterium]MBK7345687.1 MBL fold metallo-hydrolase [Chitinophagaceae bacterium]MBK8774214.1 MBL fold metallo-hydrolase [Chitinophagaceae bacterium]
MKIFPLSEGAFSIDSTKIFIPFNKKDEDIQNRPVGSLLVEVQPFCVVTSKDILLFDTGLGFTNNDGVLQLHQNLLDNGIQPGDVTKVLLSHLHKDHSGGLTMKDAATKQQILSFTNAVYYVFEKELDYGFEHNGKSYVAGDFSILKNAANVVLLKEDTGTIDGYIQYALSGAHSKFHIVFWIDDGNQAIFFGGDEAPQLQQMKNKFVAKYDFNGKKAMELRQQWWKEGTEKHWTFLFYHDIKTPYITL